jgi:hypothetical protein
MGRIIKAGTEWTRLILKPFIRAGGGARSIVNAARVGFFSRHGRLLGGLLHECDDLLGVLETGGRRRIPFHDNAGLQVYNRIERSVLNNERRHAAVIISVCDAEVIGEPVIAFFSAQRRTVVVVQHDEGAFVFFGRLQYPSTN